MFGVLEVILRYDPVPGQSFGVGQGQIAFIVSLGVLSVPRLGAGEPGRFISLGGLGSSRHGVRHNLRIWARGRAAAGLSSEMYFILGHSGGSRTTFIRGIVGWGAAVRAAIKLD